MSSILFTTVRVFFLNSKFNPKEEKRKKKEKEKKKKKKEVVEVALEQVIRESKERKQKRPVLKKECKNNKKLKDQMEDNGRSADDYIQIVLLK